MNILEQIRKEHSWLEANRAYDLRRGKPSTLQLDITQSILETIEMPFHMDNVDLRNYGDPEGIPSAKKLIIGASSENTSTLSFTRGIIFRKFSRL